MWPFPRIVAHRGGGKLAPENTLAAMRCGLAHGFHAVEFDVMLSKDGVPVVIHDPDFGRTIAGTGRVSDCTAQELAAMDAGSWFGPAFSAEKVPTLAQVANFCIENRIWMNIEIKPAPGFDEQTGRVVAAWSRRRFANEPVLPLFSSFSFAALAAAQSEAPGISRGYLVEIIPPDWRQRLDALDAIALHTDQESLSLPLARAIKDAGFGLFCYTVNDPARAREILSWGVDAFCTDRIDLIGADFA